MYGAVTSPLLTRAFRRGWLADELMNMAVMLAKATRKISSQQHRYIRFSYFQFVSCMMVNLDVITVQGVGDGISEYAFS